jgi:hypothetical protein
VWTRVVVFIFASSILCIYALAPDFDPDLYWHLRLGRDLVLNHISPFFDHLSFTFDQQPLKAVPVGFEVTAFLFYYYLGGLFGLQILKMSLWILAAYCAVEFCRRMKMNAAFTIGFVAVVAYAHSIKFLLRPDTLTLAIFPLFVGYVQSSRFEWTRKQLMVLGFLLVLWTNWHLSSVLPYCVLVAAFVENFYLNRTQPKKVIIDALIVFLPGFLNPTFSHPLLSFLQFSGEWGNLISELGPPSLKYYTEVNSGLLFISLLAAIYFFWRKRFFEALCLVLFGFQALKVARMTQISMILLAPFVLLALRDFIQELPPIRKSIKIAALFALMAVPGFALYNLLVTIPSLKRTSARVFRLKPAIQYPFSKNQKI